MKWLIGCLLALVMVSAAFAGEDPYVAIVGNDLNDANPFYLSPKYAQFLYNQENFGVPVTGEVWFSPSAFIGQPEVCDTTGVVIDEVNGVFDDLGEINAVIRKQNEGFFVWRIRLPKKPNAINVCFQCGVLKPNTFRDLGYDAVLECAAYTGERIGTGFCTRNDVNPGQNPVIPGALPQVTAVAFPGPFNSFIPFNLTAYRNPGTYNNLGQPMANNQALQVLNGPVNAATRIMLKSCFDKCINIKLPVTGQLNALGQLEEDLIYGDLIEVRLDIPRTNTVDIYCHAQSAKLVGIGEAPF